MPMPNRAKKRDANEPEIVQALRDYGVWVHHMDEPVDLLCGHMGMFYLIEVKDGDKIPSKRALTPNQAEFFKLAELRQLPVFKVETVDDAMAVARDMAR